MNYKHAFPIYPGSIPDKEFDRWVSQKYQYGPFLLDGVTWCICGCHGDDGGMMHFGPCCDLTYQRYIWSDGSVDYDRLREIVREVNGE